MVVRKDSGFTLVELSIVLVIIGLIVGGVLVGQDLIRAAETRAIVTQIEKYNVAVNTFRVKYGGVPGDMSTATSYIAGVARDGDGNGIIHEAAGLPVAVATTIAGEISLVFNHLSAAGMVDGQFTDDATATTIGTNFPALRSGRGGVVAYGAPDGINYWHIGLANAGDDTLTTANNLAPEEAFNIDNKIDDGRPNTGSVIARGGVVLDAAASSGAGAGDFCTTAATAAGLYNLVNISPLCQLRLRMN